MGVSFPIGKIVWICRHLAVVGESRHLASHTKTSTNQLAHTKPLTSIEKRLQTTLAIEKPFTPTRLCHRFPGSRPKPYPSQTLDARRTSYIWYKFFRNIWYKVATRIPGRNS